MREREREDQTRRRIQKREENGWGVMREGERGRERETNLVVEVTLAFSHVT